MTIIFTVCEVTICDDVHIPIVYFPILFQCLFEYNGFLTEC